MQVLRARNVNVFSAVSVSLLTYFWFYLWYFHGSRSYCLTLKIEA